MDAATGEFCTVKFHKETAQGVMKTYQPGKTKLVKVMIVPMPRKWERPLL